MKWIDVKVKPKSGLSVLITNSKTGKMNCGYWDKRNQEWCFNVSHESCEPQPTHWMPLPKPPV